MAECISFAGRILKERTLKGLIKSYNNELPDFFGFDEVSIMFDDEEKYNTLYTITTGEDEDNQLKYQEAISKAKLKKSQSQKQKAIEYVEAMMDMKQSLLSPNEMI